MVWSSILTLTIMGVSQRANPQTHAPTVLRVRPMVKLRIYNYGISRTLLLRSEGEATAILNHAGLAVGWVDCPLSAEEFRIVSGLPEHHGQH